MAQQAITIKSGEPAASLPHSSRARRFIEVGAIVVIWIAISTILRLERGHLLLGIPLTLAFQLGLRRQPLRTLWVRDGGPFHLDTRGWMFAVLLALFPTYYLYTTLHSGAPLGKIVLAIATVAGAIPAAYALMNFRRTMLRPFLLCLAIAGGVGVLIVVVFALGVGMEHYSLLQRIQIATTGMLRYLPICFVVEEVSFRGAFDAHLHHPGEPRDVWSALFVSALWGLWHLPGVIGQGPLLAAIPGIIGVHCFLGLPLSIFWRQSGNLLVPAFAHALADAVRNALLGAPR